MIKQLVTFGDSWPAGSEINKQYENLSLRFPELVASNLNIESTNLAESSTSFEGAVYKFLNCINTFVDSSTAILFCLSGLDRQICFQEDKIYELHPAINDTVTLNYYSHIYSKSLGEHNRIRSVLLVQELCRRFAIPVFFVNNWNDSPKHLLIDQHNFMKTSLVEILGGQNVERGNLNKGDQIYMMPRGHPNLMGHQVIATEITNWIKEKL